MQFFNYLDGLEKREGRKGVDRLRFYSLTS